MLICILKKMLAFLFIIVVLSFISVSIVFFLPNETFKSLTFLQSYSLFYNQILFDDFSAFPYISWLKLSDILFPTLELVIFAIGCSVLIGFPIGIFSGLTNNQMINNLIKFFCLLFYSSPIIFITVIGIFFISPDWILIKNTYFQQNVIHFSLIDIMLNHKNKMQLIMNHIEQIFIPVLILTIQPCIMTIQLVSEQVSMTASQNYIKVANIRENSSWKVLFRHLLPNIAPKTIHKLNYNMTTLLFLVMIIEIFLNLSGLGTWVLSAFHQKDYFVIALTIFSCGSLISFLTLLSEMTMILLYPNQED